jgi:hypothetical protein
MLCFPHGYYRNWTQFELEQINIRLEGNQLQIDTTYQLVPQEFNVQILEPIEQYPSITSFLKRPVEEWETFKKEMRCHNRPNFFIKYENGETWEEISFSATGTCSPAKEGELYRVYAELDMLREKYKIQPVNLKR